MRIKNYLCTDEYTSGQWDVFESYVYYPDFIISNQIFVYMVSVFYNSRNERFSRIEKLFTSIIFLLQVERSLMANQIRIRPKSTLNLPHHNQYPNINPVIILPYRKIFNRLQILRARKTKGMMRI